MLYALAACTTLIFVLVLAVPRTARASRLARLLTAQEAWAELMDRKTQPRRQGPWLAATPAVVKRSSGESSNPPITPAKSA